jgi:hydrogenase expression/formation protein HypC
MCIAIPYQVVEVNGNEKAWIEVAGARQEVSLQLLPEVAVGDWVLVNLGSVIAKIEENEAQEIMRLYREIAEVDTLKDSSSRSKSKRKEG